MKIHNTGIIALIKLFSLNMDMKKGDGLTNYINSEILN